MMYVLSMTKKRWLNLSVGLLLLVLSPSLLAASLGLTQSFPDITTDNLDIEFTLNGSNTGILTVSGSWSGNTPTYSAFSYNADGSSAVFFDNLEGIYQLSATLDSSGMLLGGNFSISGAISSAGITDPGTVLLNGDLSAFGFAGSTSSGGVLDWTSANASGALSADFGNDVGGILWINAGDFDSGLFNGVDMTSAFSAKGALSNTFSVTAIPLPAAVWLFVCGMAAMIGVLRKPRSD